MRLSTTGQEGPRTPSQVVFALLPPLAEIGEAEYAARWRELNPAAVARYDAQRRVVTVTAVCTSCGHEFERAPSDRREVCSAVCVKRRRREMDRRARARKAAKEGVGAGAR